MRSVAIILVLACVLTLPLGASSPMVVLQKGAQATLSEDAPAGCIFGYSWYGDTESVTNTVNKTWVDNPDTSNWWENESLVFAWNFSVVPTTRYEEVELSINSNGNDTIYLDFLIDMCDNYEIWLYDFRDRHWVIFFNGIGQESGQWIRQQFPLNADAYSTYDYNGLVQVKFVLWQEFIGTGGNWLPMLFIDYVYQIDSPPPETVYGEVPITVDQWDSSPHVFWDEVERWNTFWNNDTKTFDAPPLSQQVTVDARFLITADPFADIWFCARPSIWAEDYHDYFTGTEPVFDGFATNGIVLATTNHAYTENITADFLIDDWTYTGWYYCYVVASTYYLMDAENNIWFDGTSHGGGRFFYVNLSPSSSYPPPESDNDQNGTALPDIINPVIYDEWDYFRAIGVMSSLAVLAVGFFMLQYHPNRGMKKEKYEF